MPAYIVANYTVTNPEGYGDYPQKATETLVAHGAEVVAVDLDSQVLEGQPQPVTVILKFASKAAAKAWYDSPEYQAIVGMRANNAKGTMVLIEGF